MVGAIAASMPTLQPDRAGEAASLLFCTL